LHELLLLDWAYTQQLCTPMNIDNLLPHNLLRWFKAWLELGVSPELTDTERRRQYIVNATPAIVLLAVLFYMALFWSLGNRWLVWTTLCELPVVVSGVIWFRLRQLQHRPASYWAACGVCQLTVLTGIVSGQGTFINTHFYFLSFSLTAPLIIPITHRKRLMLVCLECMLVYLALEYFQWPAAHEVLQLPAETAKRLSLMVTVSCSTILFMAFYISESFSEELEAKLRTIASTDTLTQLANRRTFQAALTRALAHAQRNGSSLCLAMLDVDFFKQVNDRYGHDAGDEVLKHVATILRKAARSGDLPARIGGEEFVVLMHDCSAAQALVAAERIRAALEAETCVTDALAIAVTASLGIAQWDAGMEGKHVLEAADGALYQAKKNGRNRVELASPAA